MVKGMILGIEIILCWFGGKTNCCWKHSHAKINTQLIGSEDEGRHKNIQEGKLSEKQKLCRKYYRGEIWRRGKVYSGKGNLIPKYQILSKETILEKGRILRKREIIGKWNTSILYMEGSLRIKKCSTSEGGTVISIIKKYRDNGIRTEKEEQYAVSDKCFINFIIRKKKDWWEIFGTGKGVARNWKTLDKKKTVLPMVNDYWEGRHK